MKINKIWIKTICFIIGLVLMVGSIQKLFGVGDTRVYQRVQGFYEEPEDSLDAVYVGASNVYAFWQAPLAWEEFGYAIYPMSVPAMPPQAIRYMIEECRKTQPNALYIINTNIFKDTEIDVARMHYTTNYLPFSKTKIDLINVLTEESGIGGFDKLEYYLPVIRFHSRWSELTERDFEFELEGLKGASHYENFLETSVDVSQHFGESEERADITNEKKAIDELLDYCEEESVNVLFVEVPQAIVTEEKLTKSNSIRDYLMEQKYPLLDLRGEAEAIGLDFTTDYYDYLHTNIHGSAKYTRYLSQYLSENYDFVDKRQDSNYESWNIAAEEYRNIIASYISDFEGTSATIE